MSLKQFALMLVAVFGLSAAVAPTAALAGCPLSDPECKQTTQIEDETTTAETAQ